MRLSPIVARIRDQIAPMGGRVWSALAAALPTAYPAAYVLPLAERLLDGDMSMDHALIEARIGVEIMVRHATDAASGGPAHIDLEDVREAISAVLVGWRADALSGPMSYAGGRLLSFDAGLAVWRDEYVYTLIRD